MNDPEHAMLIDEMLNDRTYHIEFNGHLSNHVKHAVIALAGLGQSAQRIKAFYDNYAKLTPYGFALESPRPSRYAISESNWADFLGQRTSFGAYCDLFERQQTELGTDELLRRYLPRLIPGWVGAFTHAAIHVGWALDVDHRWMTIEGLAYLAFSAVTCHPERAVDRGRFPAERAPDSLLRIAAAWDDDRDALRRWVEDVVADQTASGMHPELARSGLQYRIARMLTEGHPLIYDIPRWIDEQEVVTSWEQLYYTATLLYLAVPGDFVLLHLITSLHGMEQIANRLPPDEQRDVVRNYWIGMLCIVFASADFPPLTTLSALHAQYVDAVDTDDRWNEILARAVEEEEEHNPKLVYVLRRIWQRTGGRSIYRVAAARFTTTPELPPSFDEPPTE